MWQNKKIINIELEEKPTGEISAGAGIGTSGTMIGFAGKENNFLGRGIQFSTNLELTDESIRGKFSVYNPNFKFHYKLDETVYNEAQLLSRKMDEGGCLSAEQLLPILYTKGTFEAINYRRGILSFWFDKNEIERFYDAQYKVTSSGHQS